MMPDLHQHTSEAEAWLVSGKDLLPEHPTLAAVHFAAAQAHATLAVAAATQY